MNGNWRLDRGRSDPDMEDENGFVVQTDPNEDKATGNKGPIMLKILGYGVLFTLLGALGTYVWTLYAEPGPVIRADIPVITPQTSEIRRAPNDPGGMEIPHRDRVVFEEFGSEAVVPTLDNSNAISPETPLFDLQLHNNNQSFFVSHANTQQDPAEIILTPSGAVPGTGDATGARPDMINGQTSDQGGNQNADGGTLVFVNPRDTIQGNAPAAQGENSAEQIANGTQANGTQIVPSPQLAGQDNQVAPGNAAQTLSAEADPESERSQAQLAAANIPLPRALPAPPAGFAPSAVTSSASANSAQLANHSPQQNENGAGGPELHNSDGQTQNSQPAQLGQNTSPVLLVPLDRDPVRLDTPPQNSGQTASQTPNVPANTSRPDVPLITAGEGYRVQLASVTQAEIAQNEWRRFVGQHGDLLANLPLVTQEAQVNNRTYYRVQTGPFDRQAANNLCQELRARAVDCLVVRQ